MLRVLACLLVLTLPAGAEGWSGAITMVDGDTLRVGDSPNLRLLGIDAYETDQPCYTADGARFGCGAWVTRTVRAGLDGRQAACQASRRDRYDRPLVRCQLNGQDLGALLVAQGLAQTYRDSTDYETEEKAAVLAARGIWAFRGQDPAVFRRTRVQGSVAPGACTIKGNISANGRIYHMQGQEHYARTGINEARGERWFCTEADARAAGWRKARR